MAVIGAVNFVDVSKELLASCDGTTIPSPPIRAGRVKRDHSKSEMDGPPVRALIYRPITG